MITMKSRLDIHTMKKIQNLGSFSLTDLLQLCKDQNILLKEDDELIGRLVAQLSEYEQELYEKDSYIKKLDNEVRQPLRTSDKEVV